MEREKVRPVIDFTEVTDHNRSKTKQSFKDECDINILLRSMRTQGDLVKLSTVVGEYGDFSSTLTYHDALNQVLEAEAAFLELPSDVRTRMRNDPGIFLEFMGDPANVEESIALGLRPAQPKEEATPVPKPPKDEAAPVPEETGK